MFEVMRANRTYVKARRLASLGRDSDAINAALEAWGILSNYRGGWSSWSIGRLALVVTVSGLIEELGTKLGRTAEVVNVLEQSIEILTNASSAVPEIRTFEPHVDHIAWATRRVNELSKFPRR